MPIILDYSYATVQAIDHSFSRDLSFPSVEVRDEQRVIIPTLSVGDTRYPLRQKFVGTYIRTLEELNIQGVSPLIVGKGKSANEARDDFCLQIHATLQALINKRPFEMTDDDHDKWNALTQFVDMTVYRNTTPIKACQFGRIKEARSHYEKVVAWEDGTTERIPIMQVNDPDYVTYCPGQPFEAIVHRDPITFELIRIVSIERRREPHRMSPEEESQLLNNIGSLDHLQQNTEWTP